MCCILSPNVNKVYPPPTESLQFIYILVKIDNISLKLLFRHFITYFFFLRKALYNTLSL